MIERIFNNIINDKKSKQEIIHFFGDYTLKSYEKTINIIKNLTKNPNPDIDISCYDDVTVIFKFVINNIAISIDYNDYQNYVSLIYNKKDICKNDLNDIKLNLKYLLN